MRAESDFPAWSGWAGAVFGVAFAIGAFRNVCAGVQLIAEVNNYLLPLWMIILGVLLIRHSRRT
jgi:hypothetical protein